MCISVKHVFFITFSMMEISQLLAAISIVTSCVRQHFRIAETDPSQPSPPFAPTDSPSPSSGGSGAAVCGATPDCRLFRLLPL